MLDSKIETLRARVAELAPDQREKLRAQVEAAGIDWARVAPSEDTAAAAKPVRPERLPLSPAQLQFWLMHQVNPGSAASAIAFSWHLSGPLDRSALARALSHLVSRHEPLRSCFPAKDAVPWQAQSATPFELEQSTCSPAEFPALEQAFVSAPFNMAAGPLFRAHLVQLGAEEHQLMLSLHHIIADGWSRGVFMRELAETYRAFRAGIEPQLPALSKDFADLLLQQQDWLKSTEADQQAAFWKARLSDLSPQSLPVRLDAKPGSQACETQLFELDAALSHRARDGAARLGATPFMLLLAVFKLLLHRYTGQDDIAVGTPTAGRSDPDAAGVIGLFVNTLVLRSRPDGKMRFSDWLTHVREGFAQSFDNQDLPFSTIVDTIGATRRAGKTPLFQTLFQVQTDSYIQQNASRIDLGDPTLRVEQRLIPLPEAKFDLSWHMMERENGFSIIAEYRSGLFEQGFIRRMARHFETLLEAVLSQPETLLSELSYLCPEDHSSLAQAGPPLEIPAPVSDQILAAAGWAPDKEALVFNGKSLTYADLDSRATELAQKLRGHPSVSEGARVVIALDRGPEMVLALLAAMKAGVAYVPLDPAQPESRKSHILADAGASLLIADKPIAAAPCPQLSFDAWEALTQKAALAPINPESLAYVIYTSGSTGRPKGVPISHASFANLIAFIGRTPGLDTATRWLAVTTVGFDIAGLELFGPLAAGGTVVLADRDTVLSPPALSEMVKVQRITHMQATPALWRALVEAKWEGKADLICLCGGEALDTALAKEILPHCKALWNMYGPTETTIWSAALQVRQEQLTGLVVPVGGPVANTGLHVLDQYGQELPPGIPGELVISGAGLSPGYWNRPDLTAESFTKGGYRTGDLVMRREDGCLDFLGRTDHQIKLNGFRVEPGEIEALLVKQGLSEALVIRDPQAARLIAYCRPGGASLDAETLKRALTAELPGYMVPAAFVFLDRFELNANGKVDRSKLPAPKQAARTTSRPPESEEEKILHRIWCAVLEQDGIGVEDNFFDLGGASVSAMQIVARAREQGMVLEPAQLFENQTIASQAQVAKLMKQVNLAPLSPWQTHLRGHRLDPWLLTRPAPSGAADHLGDAAAAIAAQHEALRVVLKGEWELDRFTAERASENTLLPVDLGAWARAEVSDTCPWRVCITPDNRLALAAHPVLFDMACAEQLVLLLQEQLDARLAGKTPVAAVGGSISQWLSQPHVSDPCKLSELPVLAAQSQDSAAPAHTELADDILLQMRTSAGALGSSLEILLLTALVQTVGQWASLQKTALDVLTSTHPGADSTVQLGNHTRLLPVTLPRLQGSPRDKLALVAKSVASAAPLGMAPRPKPSAGVLFSWRNSLVPGIEWLSRPIWPLPEGYALRLEAEATAARITLQWHFDRSRLSRSTVETLAKRVESNLMALCASPVSARAKPAKAGNRLDQLKAQIRRPKE